MLCWDLFPLFCASLSYERANTFSPLLSLSHCRCPFLQHNNILFIHWIICNGSKKIEKNIHTMMTMNRNVAENEFAGVIAVAAAKSKKKAKHRNSLNESWWWFVSNSKMKKSNECRAYCVEMYQMHTFYLEPSVCKFNWNWKWDMPASYDVKWKRMKEIRMR